MPSRKPIAPKKSAHKSRPLKRPASTPPPPLAKSQHQKFGYREVPRRLLVPAPYNPNVIEPAARALLAGKIASWGCVEALVWNELTGRLVSGHQRLSVLDELEGSLDYDVGVTVVRLSAKREREMNVFLNNAQAQGHFDKDLFLKLLAEEPLDLSELGLTRLDLEAEFGEDLPGLSFESVLAAPAVVETRPADPADGDEREMPVGDFLVVTFPSAADKTAYLEKNRFPLHVEYLSCEEFEPTLA